MTAPTGTAPPQTLPVDRGVPARATQALADLAAGQEGERREGETARYADLPDRDLDQDELMRLAASVATRPERWGREVAFDDEHRHYVCLHRDTHVDVWLLCWTPQNDTGWHDHDVSSGAVAVVQGRLTEHNLAVGATSVETTVPAGQVFSFGPDHIHRLTGLDAGSVSVHAYSPPLWRLGQYSVGSSGVLRRVSVSYADELRPLNDTAEVGR